MNKDFTQDKLISFDADKQMRILFDLASHIEKNKLDSTSKAFEKLKKYHEFLNYNLDQKVQKLNKEFAKVTETNYQFQIYLMNLERLLGQSTKEYDFLIHQEDLDHTSRIPFNIICVFDSVRSAHNVGAMIRTSECFNIQKIFTCGLTPSMKSPHVKKTAMGCDENIEIEHKDKVTELIASLKQDSYDIWSIETSKIDTDLSKIETMPDKVALIFGHEQFGVSAEVLELSDKIIPIKLYGRKNSLNVSISHGIVLNHITQFIGATK